MKMVAVDWHGITEPESRGWLVPENVSILKAATCSSIGFLVVETVDKIVLATSIIEKDGKVSAVAGSVVIPKEAIFNMYDLQNVLEEGSPLASLTS